MSHIDFGSPSLPDTSLSNQLLILLLTSEAESAISSLRASFAEEQPRASPGLTSDGIIGGLNILRDHFRSDGQAPVIESWINSGPSQQISPDHLRNALGQSTVEELARRTGIPEHDVLSRLSQSLPAFVEEITPEGRIPTEQEISSILSS